jgi:two-component system, OmpR family, alkaline phosphatase synthesis response regulator PhoP
MGNRVLIVEDERDIRELIVFTLQLGGVETHEAGNGEAGVAKAREVVPDLILMDVRMPRMTGFEACKVLKADPATKDIPIVFLSAKGQVSEIQQGMESGALEYILKPFAPDELLKQVQEILARPRS